MTQCKAAAAGGGPIARRAAEGLVGRTLRIDALVPHRIDDRLAILDPATEHAALPRRFTIWNFGGRCVEPAVNARTEAVLSSHLRELPVKISDAAARAAADRWQPWIAAVRAGWVLAEGDKRHEDRTLHYMVFVPRSQLAQVKVGQRVSVEGSLVTFHIAEWGQVAEVWLVAHTLQADTATLRCKAGHEYAPATGFKFCPADGYPLR
jgi:hypothetical protein